MVPVANRPVMEHVLNRIRRCGFTQAVATLSTLPDAVRMYFGQGGQFGVDLGYSVEEKPMGTAGSVKLAASAFGESFIVISGDVLADFDLGALVEFHKAKGAEVTLGLTRVDNPLEFGVVLTDDDGKIKGFLEKPGWGEVFSDLVNTGIYVLEPGVLDKIPSGKMFDFSKNLFPMLLGEGRAMYAMALDGYWCDIGTVDQYRRANRDCLEGRAGIRVPGEELGHSVWVEDGAALHARARLLGPVLVGRRAEIGPGAFAGNGTVIGDGSSVGLDASVSETVVWDNCTIEKQARLRGSVVCSGCHVGYGATVQRGSVLGSRAEVGKMSNIRRSVRLWPGKKIQDGSMVTRSVVWSDGARKTLFTRRGISGLANVDVDPELCSRVAVAFAADAAAAGVRRLIVSSGDDPVSRMLEAATIAGAQSAGIEVLTAGNTLPPVLRFAARKLKCPAVRIQAPPTRPGVIDLAYFDSDGLHLSRDAQRKIEAALAREDSPRVLGDRVKPTSALGDYSAQYVDSLLEELHLNAPLAGAPKVMVEAGTGEARLVSLLLGRLGIEHVFAGKGLEFEPMALPTMGSSFGISVAPEAESVSVLLPEEGYLSAERLYALLSRAWATLVPALALALPVSVPSAVQDFARKYGADVRLTKSSPRAVLEKTPLSFIYDAQAAVALLLGLLAAEETTIREIVDKLPVVHYVRKTVTCPWEAKGRIMRQLATEGVARASVEGVVAEHENGRVLVLPHAEEATYELYAEAVSWEIADELSDVYADKIRSMIRERR